MKQLKLPLIPIAVFAILLIFAASTPVFAHNGEHSSGNDSVTSSPVSDGNSSNNSHSSTKVMTETEHGNITEIKQERKVQTADQRKKVCQVRKQGLTNRSDRIVSNSKRIQNRIDGILQKAIDYKTSNNLNPADWDSLVAAAQSAQSTSSTSIAALESLKPTVDCNSTTVANDVSTFKTAAATTRDNLKAYRDSVKAVLKSLAEVKSTTKGSN